MKKLLFVAALAFPLKSDATVNQGVINTAASKFTTYSICVASQTPVDLTTLNGGTAASENWLNICVQNLDTSYAIAAGDSVSLSTKTATTATPALAGALVPAAPTVEKPAPPTCFPIVRGSSFYAMTRNTTACSAAVVTLER